MENIWKDNSEKSQKQLNIDMKEQLDDFIDTMVIQARLTKAKYDSLIAEGFTKQEALELCKKLY